ncbi:Inner kinetochore subunit fta4 [Colletotrichum trifolii]|uniref:Inner kinetochore subunit fta4 n=1 Tax=Colletotrichum trifolii TaxID=5466 RepID=A0A4R8QHB7_COLTR|nr:Inner kinetochore subunit fta4 [Colletotrichum trifolii]
MASTHTSPPTFIAQKQAFLAQQTRLLTQRVQPSRTWLAANQSSESPLSDPLIEHVVARLNHILIQYSRRAYSHQASRHVAEQIDALYLSHPSALRRDLPDEGLSLALDLTDYTAVRSLPVTWPSEGHRTRYPMEAARFADQAQRLKSLAEQKRQAQHRLGRLRRIKALLDPFSADDSGAAVQDNLVTRDGQVERELEKMRALLARVGGRVSLLPDSIDSGSLFKEHDSLLVEPVSVGEKRKIDHLLDRF